MKWLEPSPIRRGSLLRVIAPSGPFDETEFGDGIAWLREHFEVRHDADIVRRHGYFAGDDDRRLRELRDALSDPDAVGILCARGGYGALRLLPSLRDDLRARPKWLIGFSDITALHALWSRARVASWHAPMVCALGRGDTAMRAGWLASMTGDAKCVFEDIEHLTDSHEAEGRLVGGNLATLASLVGTPHAPPFDGAVLLLEDVGERPYRVDRMLTTLRLAGVFDRVSAVLLGTFTQCRAGDDGVDVWDVIRERLKGLPCPVVRGLPIGHSEKNVAVRLGAVAHVSPTSVRLG